MEIVTLWQCFKCGCPILPQTANLQLATAKWELQAASCELHAKWFSLKRVYDASSGVRNWLGLGQRLPRPAAATAATNRRQQQGDDWTINCSPVMLAPVISPHCCRRCCSRKCPIGHAFRPNYRQGVHTGGDDLRLIEQPDKYRRSVKICGSSQISRYTVGGDRGERAAHSRVKQKRNWLGKWEQRERKHGERQWNSEGDTKEYWSSPYWLFKWKLRLIAFLF